ncbi:MAG: helix-turn-helix domain-containing protein [Cyclobacteriaceae bacterium]
MIYSYREQEVGAYFAVSSDYLREKEQLADIKNLISIHWNRCKVPIPLTVDGVAIQLQPGDLTTTTYAQHVVLPRSEAELTTFTFNREFYCINDHDHEVSCNGIIFFGTQKSPIVSVSEEEKRKFDMLFEVFTDEFSTRDNTQGEMLRILLKRLIIKTTRLAKLQLIEEPLPDSQIDTIRKFNLLVDKYFKEKRQVSEYAEMLFKSPKTLSNLFAKYNHKTPLQIIHERLILEAKRLLIYTDKSAKEIAHELGFEDTGVFHKLFKKVTASTPQQFKVIQKGELTVTD